MNGHEHRDPRVGPGDELHAGDLYADVMTDAAPPELARVLDALRAPATPQELAGEAAAIAAFSAARATRRRRVPIGVPSRLDGPGGRRLVRLVAVAAATLVVLGGSALGAVGGALPGPLQNIAHDALGMVGIDVPRADDPQPDGTLDVGTSSGRGAHDGSTGSEGAGRSSTGATNNDDTGDSSSSKDDNGKSESVPGQSGTAPGQGATPPGQSGTAPGQGGTPAGQDGTPPGQAKK